MGNIRDLNLLSCWQHYQPFLRLIKGLNLCCMRLYCTSIYPKAGMFVWLLPQANKLPHAVFFFALWHPCIKVPKPIHELNLSMIQFWLLLVINPIRSLVILSEVAGSWILNPSLLQCWYNCEEAMSDFHFALVTFVSLYVPSAITSNSEVAWWSITIHFLIPLTVIPRHILLNGVFQYEASFVSFWVKPSRPFSIS